MKLLLDGEWSLPQDNDGNLKRIGKNRYEYGSPYNHSCQLVSVGYKIIDTGEIGYLFFNHKDFTGNIKDSVNKLQNLLDKADVVIGHNLKADLSWLYECGFKYDGTLYDTMIFEYVTAKGLKPTLKLSEVALRYGLQAKKDILGDYLKQGVNTNAIPMAELEEYGLGDIQTTFQLYMFQRKRYTDEPDVKTMWPAIKLSNEALAVLIDIERAGIAIDVDELDRVEKTFTQEREELFIKLTDMARSVLGDTPVNFASPEDMTKLVYSVSVKDKNAWKELFNIGSEVRNSVRKARYNKRYKEDAFRKLIKEHTTPVEKTDIVHCGACNGRGNFFRKKKDGEDFKKPTTCPECNGKQVLYVTNGKRGGFGVKPISSEYATAGGFSTDKTTINDLLERGVGEDAAIFLKGLQRLNALDTYLKSFVEGIRGCIKSDGLGHPNFNQCVTATGRLSSSGPNFQNFPRGNTFPIRKVFVSRWGKGDGVLYDTDFAQLEYRTAVMLANCEAGLQSILEGKDRHELSAAIIYNAVKEEMSDEEYQQIRQIAKASTFQPLYAGMGRTEASQAYARAFYEEHKGIKKWHDKLCSEAIDNKQIVCPDGQIFAFPFAERKDADRVTGKTQIVNYPVQHFATFTIAWCVIVELHRLMKLHNVKSKLVLQVHDSITADIHPDEKELMLDSTVNAFSSTLRLLKERFNYETNIPIGFEVSEGKNLMDKKKIFKG